MTRCFFFMQTATVSGFINLDRTFADRILQICKASVYTWQHTQRPTAFSDPGRPCHNSVETWSNEHRQEGRGCVRCSSDVLPGFSLEPGMEEQATPYNCYQTKVELILGVSRRKRITPMSLCKPQPKQTVSLKTEDLRKEVDILK